MYNSPLLGQSPPGAGQDLLPPPPSLPGTNYTCQLAPGCTSPLEATSTSIRRHLRTHGHTYKDRQNARCPWAGCSQAMRWTNVARHIKEIHLGVKVCCKKCRKAYKREETLAAHEKICIHVCHWFTTFIPATIDHSSRNNAMWEVLESCCCEKLVGLPGYLY